jgi:hypothetical protein
VRLLFAVEVSHPEVIAPSPSTVILVQVCVVYSTVTEENIHGGKRHLESPKPFKIVLSYGYVKWIELSRHMAKRKAFAITAK